MPKNRRHFYYYTLLVWIFATSMFCIASCYFFCPFKMTTCNYFRFRNTVNKNKSVLTEANSAAFLHTSAASFCFSYKPEFTESQTFYFSSQSVRIDLLYSQWRTVPLIFLLVQQQGRTCQRSFVFYSIFVSFLPIITTQA